MYFKTRLIPGRLKGRANVYLWVSDPCLCSATRLPSNEVIIWCVDMLSRSLSLSLHHRHLLSSPAPHSLIIIVITASTHKTDGQVGDVCSDHELQVAIGRRQEGSGQPEKERARFGREVPWLPPPSPPSVHPCSSSNLRVVQSSSNYRRVQKRPIAQPPIG